MTPNTPALPAPIDPADVRKGDRVRLTIEASVILTPDRRVDAADMIGLLSAEDYTETVYLLDRPEDERPYRFPRTPAPAEPQPLDPAPIALPTVEEVALAIKRALDYTTADFTAEAQAVLDLIASRVPVWQPVEPGTVKPGMVLKRTDRDGGYTVFTVKHVESYDDTYLNVRGTNGFYVALVEPGIVWSVDPRTVPAEPEPDPREAVVSEWWEQTLRGSTAKPGPSFSDLLARLDALSADA